MTFTAIVTAKKCHGCGETKPLEEFSKYHRGKHGRKPHCSPCDAARQRRYRAEKPDQYRIMDRRKHLRGAYGLTIEQYDEMLEAQGGVCAICGECPDEGLAVDHCHDTGRVRGLLCRNCNSGIALLQEDLDRFSKAAKYLETR